MTRTLFELTTEALALESILESMGGEIPDDEIGAAIDRVLDEHTEDLNAKLDGYVTLIAEYDARAEARLAESRRLKMRADADALAAERLRERLKLFFERTGRQKIETLRFRISLVPNGGKAPLRLLCPPEQIPEAFRRVVTTYKADGDAIRAALESGEQLIFASLEERGRSLRIK